MKEKVINLVKILGIGFDELIISMELDGIVIDSVEWRSEEDKVYLHIFADDMDIELDFDILSEKNKKIVLTNLNNITYN